MDKIAAERAWIKSPHFLVVTAAVESTGKNSENLKHTWVCTPLYHHIYIHTLAHTPGDTEVCFPSPSPTWVSLQWVYPRTLSKNLEKHTSTLPELYVPMCGHIWVSSVILSV